MSGIKELFLDIPGYEGYYQVSNLGRVKGLANEAARKERMLKPADRGHGYLAVSLCKRGTKQTFTVHRLVILAFHGKSFLGCNHKDGVKTNNKLSNLEYCTQSQNIQHAFKIGLSSLDHMKKPVNQFSLDREFIKTFASQEEAAKQTGIQQSSISQCTCGRRKTAGGFIWKNKGTGERNDLQRN